jgi:hypothetical protein
MELDCIALLLAVRMQHKMHWQRCNSVNLAGEAKNEVRT